jgi:hypothetical protein
MMEAAVSRGSDPKIVSQVFHKFLTLALQNFFLQGLHSGKQFYFAASF